MPLFGTDGVRGLANGPLTADLALTLAQATAVVLGQGRTAEARKAAGKRLTAVVARDPRVSGEFLSAAVAAGLASSGVDVLDAGVLPTPGGRVPDRRHRCRLRRHGLGIPQSRPRQRHQDLRPRRCQAPRRGRAAHRARDDRARSCSPPAPASAASAGSRMPRTATSCTCSASLPHRLDGLHVVLDCAHGAASGVSPETFRDAGARVTVIGADPDGLNINDGVGSTHLDSLAEHVVRVRRRRRHRPRRRRRPLPRGGRRAAASSTATRSWRSSRSR